MHKHAIKDSEKPFPDIGWESTLGCELCFRNEYKEETIWFMLLDLL